MCPNCRAVTDLEAEVDDPTDDTWEVANVEGLGPDLTSAGGINGTIPEYDERVIDGDDEGLSHSTSRLLSIRDHDQVEPRSATPPGTLNGASTALDLLSRRGARRISPPFAPTQVHPTPPNVAPTQANQVQYLRPITPTQPLLGDEDLNESSTRTPTMADHFTQDGPMTPTNNAGPFVFDGSAGRVIGRTEVGSMSETDNASSEA